MKKLLMLLTLITVCFSALLCSCANDAAVSVPSASEADLSAPVFSAPSGIYDQPFSLCITAGRGTEIRYTLDGSEPCADSLLYTGDGIEIRDRSGDANVLSAIDASNFAPGWEMEPQKVAKGTVVRAAAFSADGSRSDVTTATYLVGLKYPNVKVVSLVLDSASLFDYETGIYVLGKSYDDWYSSTPDADEYDDWVIVGNYSQRGREWERPVHMDLIGSDGSLLHQQELGLRIMGAASRTYYQKSFRLVAREEYGAKNVRFELIDGLKKEYGGSPLTKFKSFLLRNSGNDCDIAHMRDHYIQQLVQGRAFDTQGSEPAVVFINGEYWGVYTITEDYSSDYIEDNYGIDEDNVIMIKTWELEEGVDGDLDLFNEINDAIYSRDFSDPAQYEWLCSRMDIQSFIDYCCVNLYTNNSDGLFEGNNWRVWRTREPVDGHPYGDCRWRFMLYDTEMALGIYADGEDFTENSFDALECGWGWGLMLKKLLENDSFKAMFVNTFMDMRNDIFVPEKSVALLESLAAVYRPLMYDHILRNGPYWVIEWFSNINSYYPEKVRQIKNFMNGRFDLSDRLIADALSLGECRSLTLSADSPDGGTVILNTIQPDLASGEWSGIYFSDFPVTVTAVPAEGWHFAGWRGASNSAGETLSLELTRDISLTAVFERN